MVVNIITILIKYERGIGKAWEGTKKHKEREIFGRISQGFERWKPKDTPAI